jgi:hypothetical protein
MQKCNLYTIASLLVLVATMYTDNYPCYTLTCPAQIYWLIMGKNLISIEFTQLRSLHNKAKDHSFPDHNDITRIHLNKGINSQESRQFRLIH